MTGICEGRVVIVTGAANGIGREHAFAFAREGAHVVVNDLGTSREGGGRAHEAAEAVVESLRDLGVQAMADATDVTDDEGCGRLVRRVVERFGRLDVVVNNAGFVRDRMFVSTSEQEWDAVINVHLKGHFVFRGMRPHGGGSRRRRGRPSPPVSSTPAAGRGSSAASVSRRTAPRRRVSPH